MIIELNKQTEEMLKSNMKYEGFKEGEENKFIKWLLHLHNIFKG